MKLELVKEYSTLGEVSFHTRVNGDYVAGSIRFAIDKAIQAFDAIKANYTQAREEILMVEEV